MKDLEKVAIDPLMSYNLLLDRITESGNLPLDPTNPFTMLLEAAAKSISDANLSYFLYEKRHFPVLATDEKELFHHITDLDAVNLFATPAIGTFRFFLNLNNIIDYAVKVSDREYKFKIPKYSYVDVDGVRFTLMADIIGMIIIKNNRIYPYIEHTSSDETILIKNVGNIPAFIVSDNDGNEWLMFDILLSQLKIKYVTSEVTVGQTYDLELSYEDQYYTSIVECEDKSNPNRMIPLNKVYVNSIIDPDRPTIYTQINKSSVHYSIPQYYIDERMVNGKLGFYIFTTKGKMLLDLSIYEPDEFQFTLNVLDSDEYTIATTKIDISIWSKDIILGGTNRPMFREMKKKIINRTTGIIDIPITEKQLIEKGKLFGYKITKVEDLLLHRIFIANKEITSELQTLYKPFIYTSTVEFEIFDTTDLQDTINYNSSYIVIKPYTVFRKEDDRFKPLLKAELENLKALSRPQGVKYLNKNFITYTPFHYIMENSVDNIYGRAYQTLRPKLDKLEIINKNRYSELNVNINGYGIFKIENENSYHLFFRLIGNDTYNAIGSIVKLRAAIKNKSNELIYFDADRDLNLTKTYYPDSDIPFYHIKIELSDFIDEHNYITVLNGDTTSLVKEILIENELSLLLYTDDANYYNKASNDEKSYLSDEEKRGEEIIGFTRERIEFNPIQSLDHLWIRLLSYYTERKFKRVDADIPLRYDDDIYDRDPDTNCTVKVYDDDNDGKCDRWEMVKLHSKGDIVYDDSGNMLFRHRKGDILIDEFGKPIIDNILGLKRFLEMTLLDYSSIYLGNDSYIDSDKKLIDIIEKIIRFDMVELNKFTLDNTKILFKPTRDISKVRLTDGKEFDSLITPSIKLYIDKDIAVKLPNETDLTVSIGDILLRFLSKKFIVIEDIEKAIKEAYKDIALIEITGITADNRRYINIDSANRFTLKYKINSDYRIIYDYNISIERI